MLHRNKHLTQKVELFRVRSNLLQCNVTPYVFMNTRLILLISTLLLGALGTACIDADGPRELYEDDSGKDAGTQDLGLDGTLDMQVEPDMPMDDLGQDQDAEDQGQPGNCVPNRDGVIERDEVTLRAGLNAKFKVSTRAEFNTAPEEVEGESVWDLSGDFDGDSLTIVELQEPDSFWFSTDFPDATYVTRLSADSNLLGIFRSSESGLELLGVVSPEEGFTQTKLEYDPPVEVLKFPIEEGSQWETEASVSGTALGVFSLYDETYVTREAGRGILKTPFADFPVTRLRVDLERVVGFVTTTTRQYVWVSECFGTVATVRSSDNESDIEFSSPSEIRRIAP